MTLIKNNYHNYSIKTEYIGPHTISFTGIKSINITKVIVLPQNDKKEDNSKTQKIREQKK